MSTPWDPFGDFPDISGFETDGPFIRDARASNDAADEQESPPVVQQTTSNQSGNRQFVPYQPQFTRQADTSQQPKKRGFLSKFIVLASFVIVIANVPNAVRVISSLPRRDATTQQERVMTSRQVSGFDAQQELEAMQQELNKLQYENKQLKEQVAALQGETPDAGGTGSFDDRVAAFNNAEPVWEQRTYQWRSFVDGETYQISVTLDKNLYTYYLGLGRYYFTDDGDNGVLNYVYDDMNQAMLDGFIDQFRLLQDAYGWSDSQFIREIIGCIQAIPYALDEDTTGYEEYPRYPIETLWLNTGDCEDTSFLLAACLHRLGYDCALIKFPSHVGVGIRQDHAPTGTYFEMEGHDYYYIETTNSGFDIGELPDEIRDAVVSYAVIV